MKFSRLGPNIAPPVMRAQPGASLSAPAPSVSASVTYLNVPFAGVGASIVGIYPTPFAGVGGSINYNIPPFAGVGASFDPYTFPFALLHQYPFAGVDAAGLFQYAVPFESTNH